MNNIFKSVYNAMKKHSPELLIGGSIASMLGAIVLAIRNTPKMNEELDRKRNDEDLDFRPIDEAKVVIKHQLPSIILFVTGSAGIIGANAVHLKRNAALSVLVQTGEVAATQYRTIVERVVSDEDKREIDRQYNEERKKTTGQAPLIICGDRYWIKDEFTNVMFESNIQNIITAANECNSRLPDERYVSLNDFYAELGIDNSASGSVVGWNSTKMGLIRPIFDAEIIDGKPIVLMSYRTNPDETFREW